MRTLLVLGLLFLPHIATANDTPDGCVIIDHSGGYLCPPSKEKVEEYRQWLKNSPDVLVSDLIFMIGNPDICRIKQDDRLIDCSDVSLDTPIMTQTYTLGEFMDANCVHVAHTDIFVLIWQELLCFGPGV